MDVLQRIARSSGFASECPRTFFTSSSCRASRKISLFYAALQAFTGQLKRNQPGFSINPKDVRILNEPTEFYGLLLDMIRRANRRIFISSLYIGSEESELISALESALRKRDSLHLHLSLDLNRSTRPGSSSTAKILLPLLKEYPDRVHVSLFRSPSLRGILAKLVPPRFNEGWGTWHAKVYGVDDEVIISGANLNKSYFTDRQDRYIHFGEGMGGTGCGQLAQYCFDFMRVCSTFSFQLRPGNILDSRHSHSYYQDGYTVFWPDANTHPHHIHHKVESALKDFQLSYRSVNLVKTISPAESKISHGSSTALFTPAIDGEASTELDTHHVQVFPVIQAGQFGIQEEENTMEALLASLTSIPVPDLEDDALENPSTTPLLDLTSGYFALYKPYQELILPCRNVNFRIVAASPKANGFYGSSGISGRIPEGYTLYEQRFMNAVRAAGRTWRPATQSSNDTSQPSEPTKVNSSILSHPLGTGVLLNEWERPSWTYHAKGLWLSPSPASLPFVTLFGSTNLNSRSAHLDTELSFWMVLPPSKEELQHMQIPDAEIVAEPKSTAAKRERSLDNEDMPMIQLRKQLANEFWNIRKDAKEWKGDERKVRIGTKILVGLVGGML